MPSTTTRQSARDHSRSTEEDFAPSSRESAVNASPETRQHPFGSLLDLTLSTPEEKTESQEASAAPKNQTAAIGEKIASEPIVQRKEEGEEGGGFFDTLGDMGSSLWGGVSAIGSKVADTASSVGSGIVNGIANMEGDEVLSTALDFVPFVGAAKSIQEAVTGTNWVTGEELSGTERALGMAGLIPGGKILSKGADILGAGGKAASKILPDVVNKVDDVLPGIVNKTDDIFPGVMSKADDVADASKAAVGKADDVAQVSKVDELAEASNASQAAKLKAAYAAAEKANPVIESLTKEGKLPSEYITKAQAEANGWQPGKALNNTNPGKKMGGDVFENRPPAPGEKPPLPEAEGRTWTEVDVGVDYTKKNRGAERMVYSSDGLIYVTTDHYKSFHPMGQWK